MAFRGLVAAFILITFISAGQSPKATIIDARSRLREIATLPRHIKEASGLELTKLGLWTHNDGGTPMLFCLDTTGQVVKAVQLNHPNNGWEDLTLDSKNNLYVGGFGNNNNDKRSLKIYKVAHPDAITDKVHQAEIIEYSYVDQHEFPPAPSKKNFDMDAMVAIGDSLYLFTKNRTVPFDGVVKIYALPQKAGKYEARAVDSLVINTGKMLDSWITAADLSDDGKILALLGHQYVWIVKDFTAPHFSAGKLIRLDLGSFTHKAGLCFGGNDTIFVVDELEMNILGGKLYSLDLRDLLPGK